MYFILLQAYRIYIPYARIKSSQEDSNSKKIYILGRFDKIVKEPPLCMGPLADRLFDLLQFHKNGML